MTSNTKVAVVSGANKGIGFAVVRGLCKQFDGHVYITAIDENLGKTAVESLEKEGLHPKFHQLDVTDVKSVERLAVFLKQNYGGLDLLVNNAGIAFKNDAKEPFSERAEVTLRTNYWGILNVSIALFPLLRSHARVVNVSSSESAMTMKKCSEELQKQLRACDGVDQLNSYMTKFVTDVKAGDHTSKGWPSTAYGVSKIGVTLLSVIQQRDLDKDTSRQDIVVNACCPGFVKTDMTSFMGTKTIEEGADTPLYVALLPPNATSPRGQFVSDRTVQQIWPQ
jgi:NAD(P)-dependent dehydrogenase (short-subunit alcohol dehydrogenase family)